MKGTPKQVAWAEKLIAESAQWAESRVANRKYIPEYQNEMWGIPDWESARDTLTATGGAKAWIDTRNVSTEIIILHTAAIAALPAPIGKSDKQAAFGQACRLGKALCIIQIAAHRKIPAELVLPEIEKIDAKTWIEGEPEEIWYNEISGAAFAAKQRKAFEGQGYTPEDAEKLCRIEKLVEKLAEHPMNVFEGAIWDNAQECAAKRDIEGTLTRLEKLAKIIGVKVEA